ncbi:NHLP leader peptide family RiPP precursor [Paenibacillus alba]|uniref:NHLP leader peptide family RiPP n=1 Tax=Paenibacillus alba TaxID=1197127 RepID=A0ABU6GFE6_9BACL|nr:NHLP leader peptide family RiPP precursor [Paenibacillus alba]MEC0232405.1 NHLP leader peptide family RiPP precursor [Paenibacillus alba]NQX67457.1 NHLP leader peptide family natural product precursor [Paenibacillus alba]
MTSNELRSQIIQKAWEDEAFKNQLIANPKAALKQAFNITLPDDIKVKAIEETSTEFVLVIPTNPAKVLVTTNAVEYTWS